MELEILPPSAKQSVDTFWHVSANFCYHVCGVFALCVDLQNNLLYMGIYYVDTHIQ